MSIPERIKKSVETFHYNLDSYKKGNYNETQVRREFIDPFFEELGWDITNKQGYAEAYKDVIHEDAIKVGGVTKAPDYCFRIGGVRKFFLEAKKPAVNIKEDIHPAYQLRRYGWSAKLPLSILTDFEEFAVYDCRIKPAVSDKASHSRMMYLKYTDYIDKWDEIANIFSREAILKGSFDKYAESQKAKRGTTEVDAAFLQEIERWRELLARNIALRNSDLSQRELNFAVQQTVDRIVFLRICEDRGIEDYGRLMALQNGENVYKRLFEFFRKADDKYNSGLFHFKKEKYREDFDNLTPKLSIDDNALKDIFRNLYYPESPYEFSVLPADILGQVYEKFLGKVIRLTPKHQAVIEDKPEVRKAGGVYYTPTYIVNYIVKETVGKLLEGKKPGSVNNIRILDPACGSGSFLIGAYQFLLDWHLEQYVNDNPEKRAKGKKPVLYHHSVSKQGDKEEWRLTTDERKRILLSHIYGVDIDSQAVEVTKLSLLLKVLEGEDEQSLAQMSLFHERVLPDLANNIKCGNSLIGPDFYDNQQMTFDEEEVYRINVFDWNAEFPEIMKNGGFDAVIGNPPYDVMEKQRGNASWPHTALNDYVKIKSQYQPALGGKLNLFRFFLIRSALLINNKGVFGMIVPLSVLADISCSQTRKFMLFSYNNLLADCFPQKDNPHKRVFFDAKLSTVVISGERVENREYNNPKIQVKIYPANSFKDSYRESNIFLNESLLLDPKNIPIPLVDEKEWVLCKKIHSLKGVVRLGEINDFTVNRGEINQTIYRKYIKNNSEIARLLKGVEVGRYRLNEKLSQGCREWFDENLFLKENLKKSIVKHRRIATQRITGVDERLRIVATIVEPVTYFADSTNSIIIVLDSKYCLKYLLGLLNSALFQWRFKITSTNNNVGTNELNSMPFRQINFPNPTEKAQHDQIVNLVNQMLDLHKQLAEANLPQEKAVLSRQIEATDRQIDRLVYQLYDLTEEEIKIVEGEV